MSLVYLFCTTKKKKLIVDVVNVAWTSNYWNKVLGHTCYKALKLKKSSLEKFPAIGFKLFMKEISVHYKLQIQHNFYIYWKN